MYVKSMIFLKDWDGLTETEKKHIRVTISYDMSDEYSTGI